MHPLAVTVFALVVGLALAAPGQAEETSPRGKREMFGPLGLASGAIIDKTREVSNVSARGPVGANVNTFDRMDANGDGFVSFMEAEAGRTKGFNARFTDLDTNADGRISMQEWDAAAIRSGATR